jgi:hypothetical protein
LRTQPLQVEHRVLQEGLRAALLLDERVHLGVGHGDALFGGGRASRVCRELVGDDVAGEGGRGVLLALLGGHPREQGADLDWTCSSGTAVSPTMIADPACTGLPHPLTNAPAGRYRDQARPTLVYTRATFSRGRARSERPA